MFEFHKDKARYFNIQYKISAEYIIPFIEPHVDLNSKLQVLEIGCAEAGVLKAFTDRNHFCTGIELSENRIELAKKFMEKEYKNNRVKFISRNIDDIKPDKDLGHKFDLIILKDVIEHIHNQEGFISKLKSFLNPGGKVFFAFPPWQMPFGGHQQICESRFLSILPYFHLLPKPLYEFMLKTFGESNQKIKGLIEIKETGISIERFERVLKNERYRPIKRQLFLFNPIYKYKFNLNVKKQSYLISSIPILRNFLTTCAYYLVERE